MNIKIVILALVILLGITVVSVEILQNIATINVIFAPKTTSTSVSNLQPSDPMVKARFDEIANKPYDVLNYNCLNKSEDFGDYLLSRNATDVNIVIIAGDQYSHVCILWEGLIYDPTNTPPLYGVDPNKYYIALQEFGFKNRFISTYTPEWKEQNAKYNPINLTSTDTQNFNSGDLLFRYKYNILNQIKQRNFLWLSFKF